MVLLYFLGYFISLISLKPVISKFISSYYMKCTHISDRQIDNGHLDEKKTYSMAKRYNKRKIVPLSYGEQRRF